MVAIGVAIITAAIIAAAAAADNAEVQSFHIKLLIFPFCSFVYMYIVVFASYIDQVYDPSALVITTAAVVILPPFFKL